MFGQEFGNGDVFLDLEVIFMQVGNVCIVGQWFECWVVILVGYGNYVFGEGYVEMFYQQLGVQ